MKSYKKKNRLLLLRKEIKKETPLEINKQDIERNVSKSWFDRSTRNVSSIKNYSYQKISLTKVNKDNYRYNLSSNQKTSRPLKLKYKILFEREKEKPVQLKYLNNEILDELFSKQLKLQLFPFQLQISSRMQTSQYLLRTNAKFGCSLRTLRY